MPKTVYELFLEYVKYEHSFAVYWTYLGLTRGYLQKTDPSDRVREVCYTDEEIAELYAMQERDDLGLDRIKLYATAVEDGAFAFYFAKMPDEANDLHKEIYKRSARKWHSVYRQHRYSLIYDPRSERTRTFQEIKADISQFPYYIGEWDGT